MKLTYYFFFYYEKKYYFNFPRDPSMFFVLNTGIDGSLDDEMREAMRLWRENKRYIEISLFIDGELFASVSTEKYPVERTPLGYTPYSKYDDYGNRIIHFHPWTNTIWIDFRFPTLIAIER